ncbi:MAG: bifunctional biotin--[acetyl-CoA-carboxylase] synthetase/biotin operon repressor, partial [Bacillota bacterium]|nr:bifunctional biotin--[acetyl-CoA-carboxylase] synthetase/biotin operon repressor [Bacillota bacterium]
LILGIGLNISAATADFPPELQSVAGSLHPKKVTKNTLIAAMVEEIAELIANVEDPRLMAAYKDRSLVLGKTVEFSRGDRRRQGIAKDINSHGNLVVETSEGIEILCGGEISLRSENYANSR